MTRRALSIVGQIVLTLFLFVATMFTTAGWRVDSLGRQTSAGIAIAGGVLLLLHSLGTSRIPLIRQFGRAFLFAGPAALLWVAQNLLGQPWLILVQPLALGVGWILTQRGLKKSVPGADAPRIDAVYAVLLLLAVHFICSIELFHSLEQPAGRITEQYTGEEYHHAEPLLLNAANALVLPRRFEGGELRVRFNPAHASALQLRLRTHGARRECSVSLFVGCEPRIRSGFVLEAGSTFKPIGIDRDSLPFLRDPHDPEFSAVDRFLRVRFVGDRYVAFYRESESAAEVEIASARQAGVHQGEILLLAATGRVRVRDVSFVGLRGHAESATGLMAIPWQPYLPAVAVLLLALLAHLRTGRSARVCLLGCSAGAMPLAVGLRLWPAATASGEIGLLLLLYLGCCLPWWLVKTDRDRFACATWLVPVLLATGATYALHRNLPAVTASGAGRDLRAWEGARLERDLLHLQHPGLRLLNPYLADHRFASGSLSLARTEGRSRVVLLGGAPNDGGAWREDSARLADRLGAIGLEVEVADTRWPRATSSALSSFYRGVVAGFRPDVILLRITPGLLPPWPGMMEGEYLDRITAVHARRTLLDRLLEEPASEPAPPADRIGRWLERLVSLIRADGTDTVLVLAQSSDAGAEGFRSAVRTAAAGMDVPIVEVDGPGESSSEAQDALVESLNRVLRERQSRGD